MQYQRIDVKNAMVGDIVSLPIDLSKIALSGNDFVADSYIQSLKAGVFVKVGTNGYVEPAGATDTKIGVLVDSADGYANQNMPTQANGLVSVLVGSGKQFVTDNVVEESITAGVLLYTNTNGVLTSTKTGDENAVAVALSANSAGNKAILVITL